MLKQNMHWINAKMGQKCCRGFYTWASYRADEIVCIRQYVHSYKGAIYMQVSIQHSQQHNKCISYADLLIGCLTLQALPVCPLRTGS